MLASVLATASSGKIVAFLVAAISMGIVYLYGAVGETIIEKGGNLNLGIPGIMCLGALGGVIGVNTYIAIFSVENIIAWLIIIFAIVFAFLFAALGGLIYALLTVTFQANQNVTGLALTTFGVGLMKFIGSNIDQSNLTTASRSISKLFTNYDKLGWFGEIFLSHGILVYLGIIIAVAAAAAPISAPAAIHSHLPKPKVSETMAELSAETLSSAGAFTVTFTVTELLYV